RHGRDVAQSKTDTADHAGAEPHQPELVPIAPRTRPPHQQQAATTPALRGPTRSSQPPQIAAETPSRTKNNVYIQPMLATRQSQVVVNNSCASDMSGHVLLAVTPNDRDSGSQNTEKP